MMGGDREHSLHVTRPAAAAADVATDKHLTGIVFLPRLELNRPHHSRLYRCRQV